MDLLDHQRSNNYAKRSATRSSRTRTRIAAPFATTTKKLRSALMVGHVDTDDIEPEPLIPVRTAARASADHRRVDVAWPGVVLERVVAVAMSFRL